MTAKKQIGLASVLVAFTTQVATLLPLAPASAQGPVALPPPVHVQRVAPHSSKASSAGKKTQHKFSGSVRIKSHTNKKKRAKRPAAPPKPPQEFVGNLSTRTLAPGIVHKLHRGPMFINVLDIDLKKADVVVKPVLAGNSFNTLEDVKDQAQKARALAAVNGNYFKRDGTPLGTLIIDGEWIAGPIFDRTCMGITRDGRILVDRVNLHGTLTTDNPEAPSIWVNNINQPRRHGAHVIAYTRRWGDVAKLQYEGTLVAVDSAGKVVGKELMTLPIPPGGYVLSDSKDSPLAKLNIGDTCSLDWQTAPAPWSDVVNAVSGGPVLIRDGNLYVGCKDERFAKAWTGSQIHARTAVGVTADRHLLLATIEGPHTLFDVAKFLKKLGAVDAMNLDGGGSTTMVIGGKTVTRNSNHFERRVASSLAILPRGAVTPAVVQYNGAQRLDSPAGSLQPAPAPAPARAPGSLSVLNGGAMLPIVPALPAPPARTAQQLQDAIPAVAPSGRFGSVPNAGNAPAEQTALETPEKGNRYLRWVKKLNPLKD